LLSRSIGSSEVPVLKLIYIRVSVPNIQRVSVPKPVLFGKVPVPDQHTLLSYLSYLEGITKIIIIETNVYIII